MIYLKYLSFFLIGITLLLTVFQFLKRGEWWIRLADFIHLQLTVVSLTSWVFLLLFFRVDGLSLMFILVGIPLTVLHISIIFPYTGFYPKQVKSSRSLNPKDRITILEANVLMYNDAYTLLLDLIIEKDPDIVVAIETDKRWEKKLDTLSNNYPYQIKFPQDNTYGLHLYSKLLLKDEKVSFLVEDDVPSFQAKVINRDGQSIDIFVLHPKPPSPSENYLSFERDVELIIVARKIAKISGPVIITGDLNDVAWSHTSKLFQRISGLLDPRVGRGLFNTFHASYPLVRWPLDHVFHSQHFLIGEIERLKGINSDHFPIFIALHLESDMAKRLNENPENISKEDFVEVQDKLNKL